jgi:hypothetical protein
MLVHSTRADHAKRLHSLIQDRGASEGGFRSSFHARRALAAQERRIAVHASLIWIVCWRDLTNGGLLNNKCPSCEMQLAPELANEATRA